MGEIHFTRAAQTDIAEIEEYSAAHFGTDATIAYLTDLADTLRQLSGQPEIGARCGYLGRGIRSWRCRSHRIYYVRNGKDITVQRVLHYARNVSRDLI